MSDSSTSSQRSVSNLLPFLESFEEAWQGGKPLNINDVLQMQHGGARARRRLLEELIKIDLEYRWRNAADAGPMLEEYVHQYPELGSLERLPLELIAEEYRVRCQWKEVPSHASYAARFHTVGDALQIRLMEVDVELKKEFGSAGSTASHAVVAESTLITATPVVASSRTATAIPAISGYDILGELGRGGMGVVYKARQIGLNRLVALKVILAGEHADLEQIARFRIEAEAAARLQHPNIVQIHEIGEMNGLPYFSLEFVDGGSLAEKLRARGTPLLPRQAAMLVKTLAEAMHYAHAQGVVHRDLKPGNVLLLRDKILPKIADFGLAKRLDSATKHTQTGAILGTPSYMAPEQAAGRPKDIGPKTDVYALGAILYELMTGRPPFNAATPFETVMQVLHDDPVAPRRFQRRLPRDLETICLKCLEKNASNRYQDAAELASDLQRFLSGLPVHARRIGLPTIAWRLCKRHPVVSAISAILVSCIAGLMVYLFTRPAYIDVRVTPGNAHVTLDGQPLELTNGQGLHATTPGFHQLIVQAEGFLPKEERVLLVRGRTNAVVANVELWSDFGYIQGDSKPSGAEVEIRSVSGDPVLRGKTPYHSPRLKAGRYIAVVSRELFSPKQFDVTVPANDRVIPFDLVTLNPLREANETIQLLELIRELDEPWNGPYKLECTVREFFRMAYEAHPGIPVFFDYGAIRNVNPDAPDVRNEKIDFSELRLALAKSKSLTFRGMLRAVLNGMNNAGHPVAFRPDKLPSGEYIICVTTTGIANDMLFTVFHPVNDLTSGPDGLSEAQLTEAATGVLLESIAAFQAFPRTSLPWTPLGFSRSPFERPAMAPIPIKAVSVENRYWTQLLMAPTVIGLAASPYVDKFTVGPLGDVNRFVTFKKVKGEELGGINPLDAIKTRIQYSTGGQTLQITAPWVIQERMHARLQQMRQSRGLSSDILGK